MTLDVTVAGALSDAYLTVEQIDTLAAADLGTFAAAWSDADTEALPGGGPNRSRKEAAIRRATLDLEAVVEHVSSPYDPLVQARLFPRSIDQSVAGVAFIPSAVKRAQYVQALYLFSNADLLDAAASRRARGLSSFSEPNVSGSLSTDSSLGRYSPELEGVLKPLTGQAVIGWIVPS